MSASREKQLRQEQNTAGQVDNKAVQETQTRKEQKRSSLLYGVIAVIFVIVLAIAVVWRTNVIQKVATAATVDGEKYTAGEVSFYYQNVYQGFLNNNYYLVSYIGLDPYSPLQTQTINETAAAWFGAEEGQSWHDYFMAQGLQQMALIQNGLKQAEAEGFVFPDSVQTQYDDAMASMREAASANGMSVTEYLQTGLSSNITEEIYSEQMMRVLKFDTYTSAYAASLEYSTADINAAYSESPEIYDEVAYEYVRISGAAPSTTDADGNPVEPTEEESAAAMKAAKESADKLLAAVQAGGDLESLASGSDAYNYNYSDATIYSGDVVTEWLFDDARVSGDAAVLESGTNYYVAIFMDRFRNEDPTIDVRHILIQPELGTLTEGSEGYEAEQEQLMAAAVASAEDILAQWKAGDATEESFAMLAMQHSSDGSKYEGGLYTAVYPGQMVPEFNDWCFDSSRKTGDTDVVETTYGAHVMYFVDQNLPYWQTLVVSALQDADYNEWVGAFTTDVSISEGFGLKFAG